MFRLQIIKSNNINTVIAITGPGEVLSAKEEQWYRKDTDSVLKTLRTSGNGISSAEAGKRLLKYGKNRLVGKKRKPLILKFLEQFKSVLILILIGAAILSIVIGEYSDAIVIFIVITLNAIIGFFQEFKAEKAIDALKMMSEPTARVVRGGEVMEIPAENLVPGDIIALEEGYRVPGDAYVIESNSLKVDESILTGESVAVLKKVKSYDKKLTLSGQKNMLFSSTNITGGNGRAVVVRTGMSSEIGKIASMVSASETEMTPLQIRLDKLGKWITLYAVIICVMVFGILWYKVGDWSAYNEPVMTAISLAVAVIPEGLPIVVVVALAIGVQEMAKKHAIIRRIPSVETLGCTTVICTDKTGTLTKNEMTVREIFAAGSYIRVTDECVSGDDSRIPVGKFLRKGKEMSEMDKGELDHILKMSLLCNNSNVDESGNTDCDGVWKPIGDSTENALVSLAKKAGIGIREGRKRYPRSYEFTFDSDLKRMSTVNRIDDEVFLFTKGAPSIVIGLCDRISLNGKIKALTDRERKLLMNANRKMAGKAMRVLAFAERKIEKGDPLAVSGNPGGAENGESAGQDPNRENAEKNLVFLGLVGMIDPPRSETKEAIERCKKAGVRVVMITGDQKPTAVAIGKEIGIIEDESNVLTGPELDEMTEEDLAKKVEYIGGYSMAVPAHKMSIISALKKNGHVVAMTGDGVNDAPALTRADIGISMGITGTDVAKEASDMVLTDDNFGTIVGAIDGGRKIYNNIRRFIRYQLSTNVGAILIIMIASLFYGELPLLPAQILWINILMDGPPALALAMEPTTWDVMDRPPIDPKKGILTKKIVMSVVLLGVFMCIGTLYVFFGAMHRFGEDSIEKARTMAFTIFVMFQLFNVFNCRSDEKSIFSIGLFKNRYILWAVGLCLGLQIAVVYVPFMQDLFHTVALTWQEWIPMVLISSLIIAVDEIYVKVIGNKLDA